MTKEQEIYTEALKIAALIKGSNTIGARDIDILNSYHDLAAAIAQRIATIDPAQIQDGDYSKLFPVFRDKT